MMIGKKSGSVEDERYMKGGVPSRIDGTDSSQYKCFAPLSVMKLRCVKLVFLGLIVSIALRVT